MVFGAGVTKVVLAMSAPPTGTLEAGLAIATSCFAPERGPRGLGGSRRPTSREVDLVDNRIDNLVDNRTAIRGRATQVATQMLRGGPRPPFQRPRHEGGANA